MRSDTGPPRVGPGTGGKKYGGPSSMGVPTKNLHTESDRQNRYLQSDSGFV